MGASRSDKEKYFEKLKELIETYRELYEYISRNEVG